MFFNNYHALLKVNPCSEQLENYQKELEEMKNMSRQEYVAHLRRQAHFDHVY